MDIHPAEFSGLISAAVGLTFAYSALTKLKSIRGFLDGIRSYDLLPHMLVAPVALLLVSLEAVIAVVHIGNIALPVFVPLTTVVLIAFLGAVLVLLRWRPGRPCLCFGLDASRTLGAYTVVRLIGVIAAEATLLVLIARFGALPTAIHEFENLVASAAMLVLLCWGFAIRDIHAWVRLSRNEYRRRTVTPFL